MATAAISGKSLRGRGAAVAPSASSEEEEAGLGPAAWWLQVPSAAAATTTATQRVTTRPVKPLSATAPLELEALLVPPCRLSLWHQITIQLWRRLRQLRHGDAFQVALQVVFPLVFVGVSVVFQTLSKVDYSSPPIIEPMTPADFQQGLPGTNANAGLSGAAVQSMSLYAANTNASNAWLTNLTAAALGSFPSAPATPYAPPVLPFPPSHNASGQPISVVQADVLLATTNASYAAGALLLSGLNASSYGLTLLVNTSFTNVIPTLVSLWDNAILYAAWNGSSVAAAAAGAGGGVPMQLVTYYEPLPGVGTSSTEQLGAFLSAGLMGLYATFGLTMLTAVWVRTFTRLHAQ